MNNIRIRYTWRGRKGEIVQQGFDIIQIQDGAVMNFQVFKNIAPNYYDIVARDLFTQLKDTEGNDIYNNDVIRMGENDWVIEWGYDRDGIGPCWVSYAVNNRTGRFVKERKYMVDKSITAGKIIGNIHTHKELLK